MSVDKVTSNGSTEITGAEAMKAKSQGHLKGRQNSRTRKIELDWFLHILKIAHKLMSASGTRGNGNTVLLAKKVWVIKREKVAFGVGKRTNGMDDVRVKRLMKIKQCPLRRKESTCRMYGLQCWPTLNVAQSGGW